MKLGRYTEAETVLREILAIDHDNIQARNELAKLCIRTGRIEEARTLYQQILRIKPDDQLARDGLAKLINR